MEFLKRIEEKWQKAWEQNHIFEADPDPTKPKIFVTFPYPYMNGPLHLGHGFTATRVDVYARFKRMQGYNVLFPWAWHWTGGPLAGASQRVKQGDQEFIKALMEIDGVPKEEIEKFVDPIYMATYYTQEGKIAAKKMGFSIDWRREFHTTSPTYNKFIEWQYQRLRELGYVTKGTHPVVWCPSCQSPTGDADRQEGEGVSPEEYTLIKFPFGNAHLVAATFRPETIYGVTNLWIHPEATYVKAEVNGEKWIISKIATEKLKNQARKIKIISEFKGKEIIGRKCLNPVNNQELLILPGWFVDPAHATGVVYSVPAHAPFDWLALKDLKEKPEILKEFNINPAEVEAIKPISMIKVEEFGEYPAIEIVEKLGAKNQYDPKAEEATKILYKKEFHSGVLKEICGEYSGKLVREVKEKLIQDFKMKGIADTMYDLPQRVVCRCLTECTVKILEDQWFLKYSDPEWKQKAKEALNKMNIYPETAKQWFLDVIDWLKEWACARKTGLGTPLPWDKEWIVETLSDSTVYMAFYTINKHIKQYGIKPEQLTPQVFDYIFYEKGSKEEIAEKTGIKPEILEKMRNEFSYWYPVDMRNSAKELVPNHLTFFIFHHVALFPPQHWPKAIGVNGMLMIEGRKMSKSKGNFITLKNAVEEYGADTTRMVLLLGAEGMDDPDWRKENLTDLRKKLEAFYRFACNIIENAKEEEETILERWLISQLQHRIRKVTECIENLKTRTALDTAFFEVWNDFRWYIRRKGKPTNKTLFEALKTWIKLLSPFAPHICEEIWEKMNGREFISTAKWPEFQENKIDVKAEEAEKLVKNVLEDTLNIIKATKIKPQKICYYTAADWKWKIYLKMVKQATEGVPIPSQVIKEYAAKKEFKEKIKEIAKFVSKITEEINKMPQNVKQRIIKAEKIDEEKILKDAKSFFEKEFKAEVQVWSEEEKEIYDPKNRARLAEPRRPAIYIE